LALVEAFMWPNGVLKWVDMKNTLIALVVIALLIVGFVLIRGNGDSTEDPDDNATTTPDITEDDTILEGEVVSVDTTGVPADGPALITVLLDGGMEAVVAVPSMGINLCPAQANIEDYTAFEAGDMVEARGMLQTDGTVVPCESDDHYLRLVMDEEEEGTE
jgi:hypothetical protein